MPRKKSSVPKEPTQLVEPTEGGEVGGKPVEKTEIGWNPDAAPATGKTQADYIHESVTGDGSIPLAPPQSDQSHDEPCHRADEQHVGPVLMRTDKRKLLCKLTDEEKLLRGLELAGTFHKLAAEQVRQAQIKKDLAKILNDMSADQNRLVGAVETGEEEREVDVDLFMLPGNETVSEVRRDTAKPIATRPVTDYERQAFLFGPEKANENLDSIFDQATADTGAPPTED